MEEGRCKGVGRYYGRRKGGKGVGRYYGRRKGVRDVYRDPVRSRNCIMIYFTVNIYRSRFSHFYFPGT